PRRHLERDVDGRRLLALVLELGFGERGAVVDAPVDGPATLGDVALLPEELEDLDDAELVLRVDREVGPLPVAEHAERLELLALDVDVLAREVEAELADLRLGHGPRLGSELLGDLVLDGE